MYKTIQEVPLSQLTESTFVKVGTERCYKLYAFINGSLTFIKAVKASPLYNVFRSSKEATEGAEVGEIVGVGYPLSHNIYRVAQSKDENNEPMKILNFQYHY